MTIVSICRQSTTILPIYLVIIICFLRMTCSLPEMVRIGGLFDDMRNNQEYAFQKAIERINADRLVLPRCKLVSHIERSVPGDSFRAGKQVCHLMRSGIAAVFGPQSSWSARHVQSVCDTLEVPHLETRKYKISRGSCLVNLHPHPSALSDAYASIIKSLRWKSYAILYEDVDDLVHLQGLIGEQNIKPDFMAYLGETQDFRPLLKKVKNLGFSYIVLDCGVEKTYNVLKQAQQLGMTGNYHSYLLTSLDMHTLDMDEFKYAGGNFTALKLIDVDKTELKKVFSDLTETALMYDAVYLFARALHDLDASQQIEVKSLNCDDIDTFQHGYSLINYMKVVEIEGLSGLIKFDNQGLRTNVQLDIMELTEQGFRKIGMWNSSVGVNFTRTYGEKYTQIVENLHAKNFIVTALLNAPYFMRKESSEMLAGNDQFEGYAVDLIAEIAKILGFNYTFKLVADGRHGSKNRATGEWDGMIKELLDKKADMAIADLTITYEREQVVDFTTPFMNLGISILYRKPTRQAPNLFSFLSPLSFDVWLYMATAYLGVSLLLFVLARFTPYEWVNSNPCDSDSDKLDNRFSLMNCLWFTIGSLMQQGCDFLPKFSPYEWDSPHTCNVNDRDVLVNQFSMINALWFTASTLMQQGSEIIPKALSTRIVAGTWWFFTLIMISSYTANLAAFLTVERMESPITSAEDLAKQTKIKYGALRGGSTAAYFRDSNITTYQRMWTFMDGTRPSVFTASNQEGVERVMRGKGFYAFLMESTSIEYVTERNCELTQIGGLLDSKGYGIAMPPSSPYLTPVSAAILKLQEDGTLHGLKTKWWQQKRGGGTCKEESNKSRDMANELSLASVGGVFVVLLAGLGIACLTAVLEFIWKSRIETLEGRVRHDLISSHVPNSKLYDVHHQPPPGFHNVDHLPTNTY